VIPAEKRNSGSLKALLMGFTYKENIDDTRNSMAADLYHRLEKAGVSVDVTDCHADAGKVMRDYGIRLTTVMPGSTYDLVIVAVAHSEYTALDESYFEKIMNPDGVLADLKWIYKGKMHNLSYWSL
ncbi:MAG: nucleotide sugar dehydrogenase, partial [Muribaculaceae bacterium]|nr:nucleotide sugar dehydrogenase [Muribaculaceae bacterium]